MSTILERKIAAICGAIIGDAAAMPMHWIYKQEKMDEVVDGKDEVEFRDPSANPFYILKTGKNSCYADQTYQVLLSLVSNKGLDIPALKQETVKMFGPGTEYDNPNRGTKDPPIEGRWLHKSLIDFLESYKSGSDEKGFDDKSADCYCRSIPVVVLYAGRPELLTKVREVVSMTQKTPLIIASALTAARILENLILNGRNPNILEDTIKTLQDPGRSDPDENDGKLAEYLQQVLDNKSTDHTAAANNFGKACYVPGNLQTALHSIVTYDNYATAIRATIKAGGCSASRSNLIGACIAVQCGLESIPETWWQRTERFLEVSKLARDLASISSKLR
ncbi:hypothetical protein LOTGIDRAFT_232560 [Lottia gigantea]|uniref:Uncharacterized protein n=1 Tax=Lottia gigantea TaxID=225164 RepID=V4AC05_LOTGI|nr:hypothetical protein LOTGIDRAFT_232560 [Lottia gigantea]ESO94332.1 hypothetical protein LOTGIDRAFT_232560 [Lottia gigantea]